MDDNYLKNMKKLEEQEKANKCNICKGTGWILHEDENRNDVATRCTCKNNGSPSDVNKYYDRNGG